jgi:hypothetical protein
MGKNEMTSMSRHIKWEVDLQDLLARAKAVGSLSDLLVVFDMDECIAPNKSLTNVFDAGVRKVLSSLVHENGRVVHDLTDLCEEDAEVLNDFVGDAVGRVMHVIPCLRPGFRELLEYVRGLGCKVALCTLCDNSKGTVNQFVRMVDTWYHCGEGGGGGGGGGSLPRPTGPRTWAQLRAVSAEVRKRTRLFDAVVTGNMLVKWTGERDPMTTVGVVGPWGRAQKNMQWLLELTGLPSGSPVVVVEDNAWLVPKGDNVCVLEVRHFRQAVDFRAAARAAGLLGDEEDDVSSLLDSQTTFMQRYKGYRYDACQGDDAFCVIRALFEKVLSSLP